MKIAFFDPVGGASGDMILGSLCDAGVSVDELRGILGGLAVDGYRIETRREARMGIAGTRLQVVLDPAPQPHRHLHHIEKILSESRLEPAVRARALDVFGRIAAAEARVHGTTVDQVHFHEVGAVDAIVDIVGSAAGISLLGVDEVRFGRLPLGRGFVNAAHGRIPLPAPATLEILTGIPVDMVETEGETVTPTGAALLAGLGMCAPLPPGSVVSRIGYGIGAREFPDRPNLVRLVLAESGSPVSAGEVSVLTTIVDDMGGENLAFLMERLFEAGALDVYFIPATMKKSRPAVEITVLAPPALEEGLATEILRHSTSLGLRLRREARRELPREILTASTPWGSVRVKRAGTAPHWRYSPEYEDCARIARERGLRIQEVLDAALRAASDL